MAFESVEVGIKVIGANAVHMGRDRLASGAAEQRQKDGGSSGVDHIWGRPKEISDFWGCLAQCGGVRGGCGGRQVSG